MTATEIQSQKLLERILEWRFLEYGEKSQFETWRSDLSRDLSEILSLSEILNFKS